MQVDELRDKLTQFPFLLHYLGPSLQQRVARDDWFENRFVVSLVRGDGLARRIEEIFEQANLEEIGNSDKIFGVLKGSESDYDMQLFDALAEVRLACWARGNGYNDITKVTEGKTKPEFIMKKKGKRVLPK